MLSVSFVIIFLTTSSVIYAKYRNSFDEFYDSLVFAYSSHPIEDIKISTTSCSGDYKSLVEYEWYGLVR